MGRVFVSHHQAQDSDDWPEKQRATERGDREGDSHRQARPSVGDGQGGGGAGSRRHAERLAAGSSRRRRAVSSFRADRLAPRDGRVRDYGHHPWCAGERLRRSGPAAAFAPIHGHAGRRHGEQRAGRPGGPNHLAGRGARPAGNSDRGRGEAAHTGTGAAPLPCPAERRYHDGIPESAAGLPAGRDGGDLCGCHSNAGCLSTEGGAAGARHPGGRYGRRRIRKHSNGPEGHGRRSVAVSRSQGTD